MTIGASTPVFDGSTNGNGPVSEQAIVTISAGDSIWIAATSTSTQTLSLASSSGSPTLLDTVTDTVTHQQTKHYYLENPGSGTYTFTASVPGGTINAYVGCVAMGVTGGAASGILVGHGPGNFQSAPGTGTDAITSGTAQTPSGYPCLVVGLTLTSEVTATPVTGTGFTSKGTGWHWELGTDGARVEVKRITSGTAQAIFTSGTGAGSDNYCTVMAVFLEASSGGLVDVDAGTDTPAVTDSAGLSLQYAISSSDTMSVSDSLAQGLEEFREAPGGRKTVLFID